MSFDWSEYLTKNSSDPVRQQIGNNLKRLRDNRNKADYHNTFAMLSVVTLQTLRLAAKVISDLQGLSTINS
ncbi:hypothetical protein PN499_16565 [Kamptonema animale CS-326]|jgi:hypothetical protein|uniref:hypothetical protein n=1 Tax=Kamptonema animale TaxID=92934 RepID=UPI00232B7E03|nr:hypothetical protein [Kamptonema animale]MDB9512803.1 hypothetical protein [Kamptonema animale CS-326]